MPTFYPDMGLESAIVMYEHRFNRLESEHRRLHCCSLRRGKRQSIRAHVEFEALISEIKEGALDEVDTLFAEGEFK